MRSTAGPIWAWRASSVWMLVTICSNILSPAPVGQRRQADELQVGEAGLEARSGWRWRTRWGRGRAAARRTGGGRRSPPSCSSDKSRQVQSNCRSQPTSSCISSSGIWVWRNSSRPPNRAMVRQALLRPKRAPRRLPMTAANSASGRVGGVQLQGVDPLDRQLLVVLGLAHGVPHGVHGGVLLALLADVFGVGRLVGLVPRRPTSAWGSQGRPAISGGNTSSSRTYENCQSSVRARSSQDSRLNMGWESLSVVPDVLRSRVPYSGLLPTQRRGAKVRDQGSTYNS